MEDRNPIRGWNPSGDEEWSPGSPPLAELQGSRTETGSLAEGGTETAQTSGEEMVWMRRRAAPSEPNPRSATPGSDEGSISPDGILDLEMRMSPRTDSEGWSFWGAWRAESPDAVRAASTDAGHSKSWSPMKDKEPPGSLPITTTQHMIKFLDDRLPRNWTPGSLSGRASGGRWLGDQPDTDNALRSGSSGSVTPGAKRQFFKSARQRRAEKSIIPMGPDFREGPARSPEEFDREEYDHSHIPVFTPRPGSQNREDTPGPNSPRRTVRLNTVDLEASVRGLDRMLEKVTRREETAPSDHELVQQRWSSPRAFRHRPQALSPDALSQGPDECPVRGTIGGVHVHGARSPAISPSSAAEGNFHVSPGLSRPQSGRERHSSLRASPVHARDVDSRHLDETSQRVVLQAVEEQLSLGSVRDREQSSMELQVPFGVPRHVRSRDAATSLKEAAHVMEVDGLVQGHGVDLRAGLAEIFRPYGVVRKNVLLLPSSRDPRDVIALIRLPDAAAFAAAFNRGLAIGMRVARSALAALFGQNNPGSEEAASSKQDNAAASWAHHGSAVHASADEPPSKCHAMSIPRVLLSASGTSVAGSPLSALPSSSSTRRIRSARASLSAPSSSPAASDSALGFASSARGQQWCGGGGPRLDTTPCFHPQSAFAAGRLAGPDQLCAVGVLVSSGARPQPTAAAIAPKRRAASVPHRSSPPPPADLNAAPGVDAVGWGFEHRDGSVGPAAMGTVGAVSAAVAWRRRLRGTPTASPLSPTLSGAALSADGGASLFRGEDRDSNGSRAVLGLRDPPAQPPHVPVEASGSANDLEPPRQRPATAAAPGRSTLRAPGDWQSSWARRRDQDGATPRRRPASSDTRRVTVHVPLSARESTPAGLGKTQIPSQPQTRPAGGTSDVTVADSPSRPSTAPSRSLSDARPAPRTMIRAEHPLTRIGPIRHRPGSGRSSWSAAPDSGSESGSLDRVSSHCRNVHTGFPGGAADSEAPLSSSARRPQSARAPQTAGSASHGGGDGPGGPGSSSQSVAGRGGGSGSGPRRVWYSDEVLSGGASERRVTRSKLLWPYWHHVLAQVEPQHDPSPANSRGRALATHWPQPPRGASGGPRRQG